MYAERNYLNPFKSYKPRNTTIISLMLKTYNGKYMGDVLASTTRNVCATQMQFVPSVGPIRPYSGSQSSVYYELYYSRTISLDILGKQIFDFPNVLHMEFCIRPFSFQICMQPANISIRSEVIGHGIPPL